MTPQGNTRTEIDSLGGIEVPSDAYYGAQTARSLLNFDIGGERMPIEVIHALALVKKCAAKANAKLGLLDDNKRELIERAADEVLQGKHDSQFPLVVWQTGSGTQTNMNVNEVIAGRANELSTGIRGGKSPIHPNDDVNKAQSSNDAFPAAMQIAAALAVRDRLAPGVDRLLRALDVKARAFEKIVKLGRTHLMDATPITLGQEFSGHAAQVCHGLARVCAAAKDCLPLPLGGTAVGTGLNAHPGFSALCTEAIAAHTGLAFHVAPNRFERMAAHDDLVHLSGTLRTLATALTKIANDIRWSASGPRGALGELTLPENEPGSSIMPGKVNPTQGEAMVMACAQVMGNDVAVTLGGAAGNFQLNVCKPLIARNVLHSIALLGDACRSFAARCIEGTEPNEKRIAHHLNDSLMLVTALNPHVGYDAAARIAHEAHEKGTSLKDAAVALGLLTAERFDALVDVRKMTSNETPPATL